MHLGPAGVEELGRLEEPQPGHHDSDARLERPDEALQGAGGDDRVRIQEDEHCATRLARPEVGAGGVPRFSPGEATLTPSGASA